MTPENKQEILEHAMREYNNNVNPREACGVLYIEKGKEKYMPCKNIATAQINFILDPMDYAKAESRGSVVAIVHSHFNQSAKPSQGDLKACEASGLPWHIVSVPSETWHYWEPSGYKAPLLGREYLHGVLDCYSLIQDWYKLKRGITLPPFEREELWWEKGQDYYMRNFESFGFHKIDPKTVKEGDVIIMQIGKTKVANHAAIYLEGDIILHHMIDRLSSRDAYGDSNGGYWRKCTVAVVRYGKEDV